jgi:dTMP kinase
MLVNIEGIDGSGKGTQAARLQARLLARALKVELVSFPRYRETHFGQKVADFLNGRFGELHQVNPFLASLLYAGDRFESRGWLEKLIAENDVVIFDRYVPSNMAHQASKLDGAERTELIQWIETIEFGVYGLPRPDLCILLDIPPCVAQRLISKKAPRDYTDQAADLQESDSEHLTRAREVYVELARANSAWRIVPCVVNDQLRTPDEIEASIWDLVQPRLPRA